ncbi:MAG TPA: ABC transporter ATP-binding protein [Methylomirabilota bacterium]|jgi:ATP-binding cassette subfamily C protein CydCD
MYLDRQLWTFTAGVRARILATVVLGLLAVSAGIARLALLGWLLGRVLAGAPLGSLVWLAAAVALAIGLRGALDYARAMAAHGTAARVQARLREMVHAHVLALGPAHFTAVRTGDVILSVVEGVQQLEVYFGQYLPQLGVAALTPLLIFAFMAWLDLPIALVLLGAAMVTLLAPGLWHRWDSARSLARQRAYSAFGAEFLDALQGLGTLKAFGQSGARAALLAARSQELFRATMGVLGTNTLARGITDVGIALGAAVALGWGVHRVRAGAMPLETLLVILVLGVEVFRPLRDLRVLLHQGMLGVSAARGVLGLLSMRATVHDAAGAVTSASPLTPTVAFEDVTFGYPGGRRPAHERLSFAVRAGERVAIVGPSGSGKSTVARLLLRFHDPQEGRVVVGGRDVRDVPLADLRALMAVVHQDTYLFHGTVAENLRMGRPEATVAELESAAREAHAHEFIARLPQGYETVVGERGVRLSGGQRQRIAIARALLRGAPILILDEALSSVDTESEAIIQAALDRLMAGRTTLIFAHRLSSVVDADRILVLEHGRIVESGTHAELLARRGAYWRLMAGQVRARGDHDGPIEPRLADPVPRADERDRPEPAEAIVPAGGVHGWARVLSVLLGLSRGYRGRLVATFLLGVTRVAALIGVGAVSALAVLAVKRGAPVGGWIAALFVVAPLAGLLHWLESWLAHDVAYRLLADMRLRFFRVLDALAPAYLTRRRTGDLVGVATHDIELVEYFFAHTIAPAFVGVLVPAVVLGVLLACGWPMAVALAPFLAYVALGPVWGRARIDRLSARAREAAGSLNAHAVDSIQGLAEVAAFQQEARRDAEFATHARVYAEARMPFLRDLARQNALQEIATGLGGLAVAVTGATLAQRGALDSGIVPLLTLLALSAFVPVWEIAQVGRQLADTFAATQRLHAVHAEPVAVTDGPGVSSASLPQDPPTLEMVGVRFTYPGRRRPALDDVSLSVPAGSTVALVGPSGAGKTTVANLFLRFWDPTGGTVRLCGHDLPRYRLDDLRSRIALVAQDTYLFNDTLRANIRLARPSASDDEVDGAVERAALGEFVASLPDGLDTVVGERGAQLSGGQRQRVAIARAFLKDAPVLILDEATSHLDAVSEQAVRSALDRLARGRTTVVIAHRLSTVRDADQILVFDEGRLVDAGTHEALLAASALYRRLVARQGGAALATSR